MDPATLTAYSNVASSAAQLASLPMSFLSHAQARSDMAYQTELQKELMAEQQMYWEKQFNMTNSYNSPKAMARRYLEGGFSPSAGVAGSSVGQSSASVSSPGVPSPVGVPGYTQNPGQAFATVAQAASSLASAFKNTSEGKSILTMLGAQYRGLMLDNSMKQFAYELDQQNLPKKQKAEISALLGQAAKYQASADLDTEQGMLASELRLKTIQERINAITQGKILSNEALNWLTTWKTQIAEARSRIASNYKQGYYFEQAGKFQGESASREGFFNQLRNDPSARMSLLTEIRQLGDKAVAERRLTQRQAKAMRYAVEQAAFANDMKEFTYWSDQAQHYIGLGIDYQGNMFNLAKGFLGK